MSKLSPETIEAAARAAYDRGREMSLVHDAVDVTETWEEAHPQMREHWRQCVIAAFKIEPVYDVFRARILDEAKKAVGGTLFMSPKPVGAEAAGAIVIFRNRILQTLEDLKTPPT